MMRRLALISLALLLGAALLHAGLWWLATSRLEAEAGAWAERQAASGAVVAHGEVRRGGWPFEARVTYDQPGYRGLVKAPGLAPFPVAITARAAWLSWRPGAPRDAVAELDCPCTMGPPGGEIPVTAEALRLVLPLGGDPPSLEGRMLVLLLPQGPLGIASLHAAQRADRGSAGQVSMIGIALPPPEGQWLLGSRIASLTVAAGIEGEVPPHRDPPRALAAWRDAGGRLLLDRLALAWGPLVVDGAATIMLDATLQPRGAATARLSGYNQTLDRLSAAGVIGRGQAALARIALSAASRPAEGGGERVVEVPLALEDRVLTAARIPLLRLPEIDWR